MSLCQSSSSVFCGKHLLRWNKLIVFKDISHSFRFPKVREGNAICKLLCQILTHNMYFAWNINIISIWYKHVFTLIINSSTCYNKSVDSVKNWKTKPCKWFLKATWDYEEKSGEENSGDLCKCVKGAKTNKKNYQKTVSFWNLNILNNAPK